jgi:hypothetical protein
LFQSSMSNMSVESQVSSFENNKTPQ